MRYAVVAEADRDLEAASGRLQLIDRLAELFRQTPAELLPTVCLLCQGQIAPDFAGVELGLAERLAARAVAQAAGAPVPPHRPVPALAARPRPPLLHLRPAGGDRQLRPRSGPGDHDDLTAYLQPQRPGPSRYAAVVRPAIAPHRAWSPWQAPGRQPGHFACTYVTPCRYPACTAG